MDNPAASRPLAAVALFLHERAAATRAVFAAIRAAQPSCLFLIADGPTGRPGSEERAAAARAEVAIVDWPCRVERLYAETNLGCRMRQFTGIEAVFSAVDAAIFLEDDCLPQPGAIRWMSRMLVRWRDEARIMMVTAANPLEEWRADDRTWHLARYGTAWGWGTWRRDWAGFTAVAPDPADAAMRTQLAAILPEPSQRTRHLAGLAAVADGSWDALDVLWEHRRLLRDGLAIVPARNMIDNLGLGAGATHTGRATPIERLRRAWPASDIDRDPADLAPDDAFDRLVWELRSGRHSAGSLAMWAGRMIARGRAVQAMALLHGGRRQFPDDPALTDLAGRAVAALGRRS
ncbi:hemolytic protein HlpA [Allostella sp. ATCC 35155]|nr:hemolytic protein HlpA [Stella sp. ATCC 35155]